VRRLVSLYVWLFRGVPILVRSTFSISASWPTSAASRPWPSCTWTARSPPQVLVLGLTSAAYQSQIFRGAIQGLPEGQLKAARALGMSDATAIACIILPQALRLSIPGWSNEYSILLKDSALAFVIGVLEVMSRTRSVAATTHQPLPLSLLAGVIFFVLTWAGLKALRILEAKVRMEGYSHQGSL
jgi:polar amino acid transport system permease protein